MTALLLALLLGQPDTLLVTVELVETQDRVLVEAVLEPDSTLRLPAEPVGRLLGVSFPTPWITVEHLQAAYPSVRFVWLPRELRVVVLDELRALPASRAANQRVLAQNRMAFGVPQQSSPYLSLAFDDRTALLDAGYWWKGKVAIGARVDNAGAAVWNITASPSPHLLLGYTDGVEQPPQLSARVAAGPIWLAGSWSGASSRTDVAGLVRLGPLQAFASPQFAVLTLQADAHVSVQLAQTWTTQRTAARISIGPSYASPFSFPMTSISQRR